MVWGCNRTSRHSRECERNRSRPVFFSSKFWRGDFTRENFSFSRKLTPNGHRLSRCHTSPISFFWLVSKKKNLYAERTLKRVYLFRNTKSILRDVSIPFKFATGSVSRGCPSYCWPSGASAWVVRPQPLPPQPASPPMSRSISFPQAQELGHEENTLLSPLSHHPNIP